MATVETRRVQLLLIERETSKTSKSVFSPKNVRSRSSLFSSVVSANDSYKEVPAGNLLVYESLGEFPADSTARKEGE